MPKTLSRKSLKTKKQKKLIRNKKASNKVAPNFIFNSKKLSPIMNVNSEPERAKLAKAIISGIEKGQHIKWAEIMTIHEGIVDSQHKVLLKKFDEIVRNIQSNDLGVLRGLLDFLDNYIHTHFTYEQGYMLKVGYPNKDFEAHKRLHDGFVKFYINFKNKFNYFYMNKRLTNKILIDLMLEAKKYLGEWFITHIFVIDYKIYKFVKAKKNFSKLKSLKSKEFLPSNNKKLKKQLIMGSSNSAKGKTKRIFLKTGISGLDELFIDGIPNGSSVLIAGGAGTGKTILCLQTLFNLANSGKKCLYLTLEETEENLKMHMEDFGWDWKSLEKKNRLRIVKKEPVILASDVEAMLAKAKGELIADLGDILEIIPKDFKPDVIFLDSISSIDAAFTTKENKGYRVFIEQLFKYFIHLKVTSFLISESNQSPNRYLSREGVEEFLADGIIVIYSLNHMNVRDSAIEVLKMRGEKHQKKIVAMSITDQGIAVYPNQVIFKDAMNGNKSDNS